VTADASEEVLRSVLTRVPEIALHEGELPDTSEPERWQRLEKRVLAIREKLEEDPDAFLEDLLTWRPDLTHLPLLRGEDCRRDPAQALYAEAVAHCSHRALAAATPHPAAAPRWSRDVPFPLPKDPGVFWRELSESHAGPLLKEDGAVAALGQILRAEHAPLRRSLVARLSKEDGRAATTLLARCAVFDLDADVRAAAVAALKGRPAEDYIDTLLEGLRYPWPPPAGRAAEALAALRPEQAVPRLVGLLGEPDPDTPFLKTVDGKAVPVVRELVRLNHLRNCLLCHPPSFSGHGPARGAVPVPGSRIAYYSRDARPTLVVRADVTYLRQDFSVLQRAPYHSVWPAVQRYDFLVRTRPLTDSERAAWEAREKQTRLQPLSAYKRALLFALRGVTGRDAVPSAGDWRHAMHSAGTDRKLASSAGAVGRKNPR
jgi:hypothetical protein